MGVCDPHPFPIHIILRLREGVGRGGITTMSSRPDMGLGRRNRVRQLSLPLDQDRHDGWPEKGEGGMM